MASIAAPRHLREVANSRFLEHETKKQVRWSQEEIDDLASRVQKKRMRQPTMSLAKLVAAVQNQDDWPKERRRKIGTKDCKPIAEALVKLDMDLIEIRDRTLSQMHDTIESLKSQILDREAILCNLHPDEVTRRFSQVVFDNLSTADIINLFKADQILRCIPLTEVFAFVGKALVGGLASVEDRLNEHLAEHPVAKANGTKSNGVHSIPTKKTIAIIGFQQHDLAAIKCIFGQGVEVVYVQKNGDGMPPSPDYLIIHEDFTPGQTKQRLRKTFQHNHTTYSGPTNRLSHYLDKLPFFQSIRKPR